MELYDNLIFNSCYLNVSLVSVKLDHKNKHKTKTDQNMEEIESPNKRVKKKLRLESKFSDLFPRTCAMDLRDPDLIQLG